MKSSGYKRDISDFYIEPVEASIALFKYLKVPPGTLILDPACGSGNILRGAYECGLRALGADIVDRGAPKSIVADFFTSEYSPKEIGWICSNPPYGRAMEFIERALPMARIGVAMLLRLEFLESRKRLAFFRAMPPTDVLVFANRISMPPGDQLRAGTIKARGGSIAYCWMVWRQPGRQGSHTHLDWITT